MEARQMLAGDLAGAFGEQATLVADLNSTLKSLSIVEDIEFRGLHYLIVETETSSEIWRTDSTPEGTEKLAEVPGVTLSQLTVAGDRLFYVLDSSTNVSIWAIEDATPELQATVVSKAGSPETSQNMSYDGLQAIQYSLFEVDDVLFATVSWLDPQYEDHSTPTTELYSNAAGELKRYYTTGDRFLKVGRNGNHFDLQVQDIFWIDLVVRTNPITQETQILGRPGEPNVPEVFPEFPNQFRSDWELDTIQHLFGIEELNTESTTFDLRHRSWARDTLIETNQGVAFQTQPATGLAGLWTSDGSLQGSTKIVDELFTDKIDYLGAAGEFYVLEDAQRLTVHRAEPGDSLIVATKKRISFTVPPLPQRVVSTDGTAAGTTVTSIPENAEVLIPLGELGEANLFREQCGSIWAIADGQPNRLTETSLTRCSPSQPSQIDVQFRDQAAWVTSVGLYGSGDTWVTDGSPTGTHRLSARFPDTPEKNGPRVQSNVAFIGDTGYFFGSPWGSNNVVLYQSDGTFDGTSRVRSRLDFGQSRFVASLNGKGLLFLDEQGLWRTDATRDGTSLLKQFTGGASKIVEFDGKFFFVADDGQHGNELWMTDGTAEGTQLAVDINAGPAGSDPFSLTVSGEELFFTADDGVHGEELWKVALVEPIERLVGDANGDRQVNFTDFLVLSKNFGSVTLAGAEDGDFDANGIVNFADFLLLSKDFGRIA